VGPWGNWISANSSGALQGGQGETREVGSDAGLLGCRASSHKASLLHKGAVKGTFMQGV
jgi:hypothetical protein